MAERMTRTVGAPALGTLLRGFRDRCDVGLAGMVSTARRTPGLRREELALLAGVSGDYLVQLEQGRATRPSAPVVAALSRALRLDEEDSALLHRAAGLAPATGSVARAVPDSVERMVTRLRDWPVAVYSADWWLLRWNTAWTALLGDSTALQGRARNVVWYEMTQPSPSVWVDPREDEAFRDAIVGDLRVALLEHPDDAELLDLVTALQETSPEFVERWTAARPARYRGMRKHVDHPDVGPLVLDGDVLQVPGCDLRIVVYSPAPDTEDADRLARLTTRDATVGTEVPRGGVATVGDRSIAAGRSCGGDPVASGGLDDGRPAGQGRDPDLWSDVVPTTDSASSPELHRRAVRSPASGSRRASTAPLP